MERSIQIRRQSVRSRTRSFELHRPEPPGWAKPSPPPPPWPDFGSCLCRWIPLCRPLHTPSDIPQIATNQNTKAYLCSVKSIQGRGEVPQTYAPSSVRSSDLFPASLVCRRMSVVPRDGPGATHSCSKRQWRTLQWRRSGGRMLLAEYA